MASVSTNVGAEVRSKAGGIYQFPARGRILRVADGSITFNPAGANYELDLTLPGNAGSAGKASLRPGMRVEGIIRVISRKVWTVPSGGNFISPVFGPPRTIQGRIRYVDKETLVVQAGVPIVVELSHDQETLDLINGPLKVGVMANVIALPGAGFELLAGASSGEGDRLVSRT